MTEVFGSKLISDKLDGAAERLTLEQARGRVLLKVEQCPSVAVSPDVPIEAEDSSSSSSDEDERDAKESKKKDPKIVPSLSKLGVYTTSIKPKADDFLRGSRPYHLVTNISESAMYHLLSRIAAIP